MSEPGQPAASVEAMTPFPVKARLCVMMFLQYFVQGCYLPIASIYLQDSLHFPPSVLGMFGSAIAVGPLLAPFLLGQLVDRYFATERVLAACHLLAGLLMIALYLQTSVWLVLVLGTLYSICYVPTMMLSNALAFHHLASRDREFPRVRLWGTIGFVVPAWLIEMFWLKGLTGDALNNARGVALVTSGVVGLVMAVYCLTLPHTPPKPRDDHRFAPGAVIGLLSQRYFLVLVVVSFFIAIAHKFFFVWNSPFLRDVLDSGGWQEAYEQRISSIGQICEVGVMAVLGLMIARLGFKWTMTVGAAAYAVRCLLFAMVFGLELPFAGRMAVVCAGQALHGLCFGCFLATAFMYVDRVVGSDLRGSMQTIYGTLILGFGFFCGGLVSGEVGNVFSSQVGEVVVHQWTSIWLSCAALAAACVAAMVLLFPRDAPGVEQDSASMAAD